MHTQLLYVSRCTVGQYSLLSPPPSVPPSPSLSLIIHSLTVNDFNINSYSHYPCSQLVWLETPTNPTLRVVDIKAIAEVAHKKVSLAHSSTITVATATCMKL